MTDRNIEGVADVQRALRGLNEKISDKVSLKALRKGAKEMLKEVRAALPKKTGRLRKATVIKTSRIDKVRKNGSVGVYITIKKGNTRNDPRGAIYGMWVENGYKRGNTEVAGQKVLADTFEATKESALTTILADMESEGQRVIASLGAS